MQAAASGIEKDFTLLVSSFREGNYLKLITIAEQNPDLLLSQIRKNPKALLIQNPEGNTFLHELIEQGHKELAIQLAKLNSYDIKIENGYIKFLYDSPGFLNYSDIKIAEKSIQNSAEIELEQRFSALTGKPIGEYRGEYRGEEEYAGREEKLINLLNELPSVPTQIKAQSPKLEIELDEIQQEFTTIFGESLGESDQLPEEQALIEKEKPSSASSHASHINQNSTAQEHKKPSQEIRWKGKAKQESSADQNQRNLNPLTSITIREKDQDGDTKIHQLIKGKKVKELKEFIETNIEILKDTPIMDEFETVPAICLRDKYGENPLHMMLKDIETWGNDLIIEIAKLHPHMIHVEDNFGIIPFDYTQPNSNLEKAFIELDPLANKFGKTREIAIQETNQHNKEKKEPDQEIRRRKGPSEKTKPLNKQDLLNNLLLNQCKNKNINLYVVKNLIGRGADPKAKDENGNSAISYAVEAENRIEALQILHPQKNSTTDIEYAIQTNSPNLQKHFKGEKEKNLPLPAYTTFGSIIGGALGATGCLLVASVYASSWAFPPVGLALTIIGGCMALGLIAGAIISKIVTDSTTPFLEKTEKDNNNEHGNKKNGKTIVVSDRTPESSQSSTALRLY